MKKLILASLALLSLLAVSCDDDNDKDSYVIRSNALPALSREIVATYFPGETIVLAEKKNIAEPNGTLYETKLSNDFELDFKADGNWTEIDGGTQEVPSDLIPEEIKIYVSENYPDLTITQIEKKSFYDVELSNGFNLLFGLNGGFIRVNK